MLKLSSRALTSVVYPPVQCTIQVKHIDAGYFFLYKLMRSSDNKVQPARESYKYNRPNAICQFSLLAYSRARFPAARKIKPSSGLSKHFFFQRPWCGVADKWGSI